MKLSSIGACALAVAALTACKYSALPPLSGDAHSGGDSLGGDSLGGDGQLSSADALTSLVFRAADNPALAADVTATFSGTMATATVPLGANESLIATFTTTGDHVEVAGTAQQSGVTANDFFGPVTYHVVAQDGSSQDYAVVVTAPVAQQAYIKASNTGANAYFGTNLAMSSDGTTLVVGAYGEASGATGINGNQQDTSAMSAGAVYVLTRTGTQWVQQAYVKASNTGAGDQFGHAVAVSSDGNTLAVGAPAEASAATGINGNQADNTVAFSGAVYVFTRSGGTWTQQAYIKASNTGSSDEFGTAVALSGDGNTLAAGAPLEDSASIGINGNQTNNTTSNAGAAYVFTRSGSTWTQQAYVKASNTKVGQIFGNAVTLSLDGNTLAVGAPWESSNATGINGNQTDTSASRAGAAYVFTRSGTLWSQQAFVKASNTNAQDEFGLGGLTLSGDGLTLAVAAMNETSAATGINGDQGDNTSSGEGAVYVYTSTNGTWSQQAYVKPSNSPPLGGIQFGYNLQLSGDGNTLAIGGPGDQSSATGIDGNQQDTAANASGAVYLFTRAGMTWIQEAYIKASNPDASDYFGTLALSSDGKMLVVGAQYEASNAIGVGGSQTDNSVAAAGAVYVFH